MHTHRAESFLIYDNVRLEIVHESNPFFAGEPISLILRLKHLGSTKEYEKLKADIHRYHEKIENELNSKQIHLDELNKNQHENSSSWSLGSLLRNPFMKENQLNNTVMKEMEQLSINEETHIKILTDQLQFHKPINLISGFIQITGLFQYNISLIDDDNFKNKDTKIVSTINHNNTNINTTTTTTTTTNTVSTIATMNSYKTNNNNHNNTTTSNRYTGILPSSKSNINSIEDSIKFFNSKFETGPSLGKKTFITPNPNFLYTGSKYKPSDTTNEYNELPLFLIPQTLLFPEIILQPGETRTFHFKSSNLPKDLCPSYSISSNNVGINYNIEFGVNVITLKEIIPVNLKIPIFISPFINKWSQQYTMILNEATYIMSPATVKEILNEHPKRVSSTTSVFSNSIGAIGNISDRRRSSSVSSSFFSNVIDSKSDKHEQKLDTDPINLLKKNFVDIIRKNITNDLDIDQLVRMQLTYQFQETETENEKENIVPDFDKLHRNDKHITRSNISSFKRSLPDIEIQDIENITDKSPDNDNLTHQDGKLVPQLNNNLQKKFIVNRNGKSIAQIKLSKFFYTIADDINLVIYPEQTSAFHISAVKVSLQCIELFNKLYVLEEDQTKPFYKTICEAHAVSFDKTNALPLKLILPRSPMNHLPSQFKTNIFEIKWVLKFTFILIDKKSNNTEETFAYNGHLEQFYEDKKGILYHSKESLDGLDFTFRVPIDILPSVDDFSGL